MKKSFGFALLFALCLMGLGCASNSSSHSSNAQGSVFVTGEDAPASAVVGFNVTIDNLTLNNGTTTVSAISSPEAVDFARLLGLRTLLGFNTIPAGTYNSVTFTFENTNPVPVISYVNMTPTPTVQTIPGSFSQTTVTIPFPAGAPLVVGANGLAGLRIDFDLHDSLATSNGQITGVINPVINVSAVSASSEVGQITDFTGNLVSVNTSGNSFLMQGPYGVPRTIDVNSDTQYNANNNGLGTLTQNAIVSVVGTMQADGSILASMVEQITTDQAFISGRILAVNPTSGPVTSVTMWVGEELGTSGVIPVDTVPPPINLSGVSADNYEICFFDNLLTNQVFNDSSLVVGQRIFIGGTVAGGAFTPSMVSLRRQGVYGALVADSVSMPNGPSSNLGSFQMQNDALMSYSAGGPFTVLTGNLTVFENIDGLSGLAAAGTPPLVSRGLVFKNQSTGVPFVVAGRVRVLPPPQ